VVNLKTIEAFFKDYQYDDPPLVRVLAQLMERVSALEKEVLILKEEKNNTKITLKYNYFFMFF
jgi:hypothetical protein